MVFTSIAPPLLHNRTTLRSGEQGEPAAAQALFL